MSIHEEERLEQSYDVRLIRRLLHYARPHKKMLVIALLLVLLITGTELSGPYVIKVAIDNHMNGLTLPMVDYTDSPVPKGAAVTEFDGKKLIRIRELQGTVDESQYGGMPKYRIEDSGDAYVLRSIEPQGSAAHETVPLTKDDIALFREQDVAALYKLSALFLGLITSAFLLNYTQTYVLNLTAQRIIRKMRTDLFSHLQRLSFAFFDRNPVGRLVTRVTNDTQALNEMYSNVMINLIKDIFMLLGIMGVMMFMNMNLALMTFITLPLIIAATVVYRKYARVAMQEVRIKLSRINASLNENISGMRIVQMFHREKQQYDKVHAINRSHFDANTKELHLSSLYRPIMDFIYAIGLALLIWFGGGKLVSGALEFGVLYAFIDYVNRFFKPIQDLAEKFTILQQSMVSAERIFQLTDETDDLPEPQQPRQLSNVKWEIVFDQVSFAYTPGDWVLRDINLTIKPGQTVAFVGATGAGKSSIISLLCRFYDVNEGRITIDGVDIRDVPKQELRRRIGLVQQDVFLFSEDVMTNIRLGNQEINDEEIRDIC
jgi:ATP-binding cassette subfamily B multidrug efflux pump